MDLKQMFYAEELSVYLNATYEANFKDNLLALVYEANKITIFAVKTPNGITRSAQIGNKVLHGYVLGRGVWFHVYFDINNVDKKIVFKIFQKLRQPA